MGYWLEDAAESSWFLATGLSKTITGRPSSCLHYIILPVFSSQQSGMMYFQRKCVVLHFILTGAIVDWVLIAITASGLWTPQP